MQITNEHGLPQAFIDFAKSDKYSRGAADISVTSLIDSPRVSILKGQRESDITMDAVDMIWPLLGTAVHSILDQSQERGNVIKEERLFMDVNGWTISGAIDHQEIVDNKVLITDYKVTSVWSVIYGKKDWELQQNVYAQLIRKVKGLEVESIKICAVLRDWNRRDAQFKSDYPKSPITMVQLNLWDESEAQAYIEDRVNLHQSAVMDWDLNEHLVECSDEERWSKEDSWAVKRPGAKRAIKVFWSHQEAIDYMASQPVALVIEHRKGARTRCENYCAVSDFCTQWAMERVLKKMENDDE